MSPDDPTASTSRRRRWGAAAQRALRGLRGLRGQPGLSTGLGALLVLAGALVWRLAMASTVTVTTTADTVDGTTTSIAALQADKGADGQISLREAVTAALNDAGTGPHTVSVPAGTFNLSSTGLTINASLIIQGAGAGSTVISGQSAARVFTTTSTLSLQSLTVSSGTVNGDGGCINATGGSLTLTSVTLSSCTASNGKGGAIAASGTTLTLTSSTVQNSTATSGDGGGVYLSGGSLTATSSTFSGNRSNNGGGGAVWLAGAATGSFTDSSFSSNQSGNTGGGGLGTASSGAVAITRATFSANAGNNGNGGGLYVSSGTTAVVNATFNTNSTNNGGGAVAVAGGTLSLTNATVAGNTVMNGAAGLMQSSGTLSLRNTLVASNTGGSGNCNGTITNTSNNLDSGTTCGFGTANSSLSSSNPLLSALASNGGSTQTMALGVGSPAINAGTATSAPTTDQRGYTRSGSTDIGAFEYGGGAGVTYAVSGTVFEDVNYGGGVGRSSSSTGAAGVTGARVELYDANGAFVSAATTASGGTYSFSGLSASTTYYVRVVNSTVLSTRSGSSASLVPVMTYRRAASTGTSGGVTAEVGGLNPAAVDAVAGASGTSLWTLCAAENATCSFTGTRTVRFAADTSTAAGSAHKVLTGGTACTTGVFGDPLNGATKACYLLNADYQSFSTVHINSANVTTLDFGFNFSTVSNTNDSGQGSLRQAITNANTLGGDASLAQSGRTAAIENVIFMIPNGTDGSGGSLALTGGGLRSSYNYGTSGAATISPTSELPTVSTPMVINAQAQPGWATTPVLRVDGASAPTSANGLTLTSTGSTVRGLSITNFYAGVYLSGGSGHLVAGNHIGIDAAGTTAAGNRDSGVYAFGASSPTVGGSATADRNVISGNVKSGVYLHTGTTGASVQANYIGTNAAGTAAVANNTGNQTAYAGVTLNGATSSLIGGSSAALRNIISGNNQSGVHVQSGSTGNTVAGNYIGTDAAGTAALPNSVNGVLVEANSTIVGGSSAAAGNVITGKASGSPYGVRVNTASSVTVQYNKIGTNAAGTAALSAPIYGLALTSATNAVVRDNQVSGNFIGIWLANGSGHLLYGNLIGTDAAGTGAIANTSYGLWISDGADNNTVGGTNAGEPNTIAYNPVGVRLSASSSGTPQRQRISGNRIYSNTALGIDLTTGLYPSNVEGVNANDGATSSGQPNLSMDHPVFTSAILSGTSLSVAGHVGSAANQTSFAGARVEIFISDNDSSGYGEGQTYLGFLTADANGNFSGTLSGVSGVTANSSKLTGTATDTNGNTSEFGPNLTVTLPGISGTVFEDVNYGGGAGRSLSASSGVGVNGATVELYDSSGVYVSSTTTASGGTYSFTSLAAGTYHVRVASSTVPSQRSGTTSSLRGVLTYRITATSGTAVAVADHVGGTNPALVDPGSASSGATFNTSTFVYSAGLSGTAQAVASVTLSTANIASVDFGFNFSTVVNTNDSGQGSLRQAITNANALGGDSSLAQSGRTAGIEHVVFMIPNGTSGSGGSLNLGAGGLRAEYNLFVAGVATVTPTSTLPTLSTPMVVDAQAQPGWTANPLVHINGASAGGGSSPGLTVTGGSTVLRGLAVLGYSTAWGVHISGSSANRVEGCWVGVNATGTAAAATRQGIWIENSANNVVGGSTSAQRNVLSGNTFNGLVLNNATGTQVLGNFIGLNAAGTAALANGASGMVLIGNSTGTLIGGTLTGQGNVIAGNGGGGSAGGISIGASTATGSVIRGNVFGMNAAQSAPIATVGYGIFVTAANTTIGGATAGAGNVITAHSLDGIAVTGAATTAVSIQGNSIYGNTGIGIDLADNGANANDGAKTASQPNLLMDAPVFTSATMSGTTLTVTGYVGSAAGQSTFASSRVEVFVSDSSSASGQGRTYLGFVTAGASGNFSGSITGVTGVTAGTSSLTGTATDGSGNTSEFGANVTVGSGISGTVFEDPNYGGGAGRSLPASGGVGVAGATVELYNSSGVYVSSTTTASGGTYSFTSLAAGTYHVRVASSTVPSQRSGTTSSLRGVLTYRTTAATGTAVAVADHVGGTNPALVDPGSASSGATFNTSTFVYSAGLSGTAQAVAPVTLSTANIASVDFGFNFSTVANTNDSGQGSLRQAITNANTLAGDSSLAQSGRTAGIEHVVFMIPNGTTGSGGSLNLGAGGLRTSYNDFTSGVATIAPTTTLPALTTAMVLDAQAQPGWTLNPVIELNGTAVTTTPYGLRLQGGSTVRGFIINRFSQRGISTSVAGGNTITGNWLGLSSSGSAAPSSTLFGVYIDTASDVIGGSTAAARNVISGATTGGILVNTSASGTRITGNYIGTTTDGSAAVANGYGVRVLTATGVQIGGTATGEGNLISGNTTMGVRIEASSNVVEGNLIGTNAAGTAALANGSNGVYLYASGGATVQGNRIGGTSSAARNVISGNGSDGVVLIGAAATNNDVQGNYIGTNAAGTAAVANQRFGVYISTDASGNRVGGSSSSAGNLVSGNVSNGLRIASTSTANTVQGNVIGLNAAGSAALANGGSGVYLNLASNQVVGGSASGAGNVVSGNTLDGIYLTGSSSNTVQGNRIGTDAAGTLALPNQRHGVWLTSASLNNAVGGVSAGEGNTIANNSSAGVNISLSDSSTANPGDSSDISGNSVRGNSLRGNGGLGIDLLGATGVNANDGAKTALQANLLMDHPVLTSARARGNQLTVAGYVGSAAGQAVFAGSRVDLYLGDGDSSGHGEGQTYLGTLTADASGNFSGTVTLSVATLAMGTQLTATATDSSNNTSEFGPQYSGLVVDFVVNTTDDLVDANVGDGHCLNASGLCSLRAALAELNAWSSLAATPTVVFDLPGCTSAGASACRIAPATALPTVTRALVIDAQTQPGWTQSPWVELDGSGAPSFASGLDISAAGSTVRGLAIGNFGQSGIQVAANDVLIEGNHIGVAADGTTARSNGAAGSATGGVAVISGTGVVVGGTSAAQRNVLSGNGGAGVWIAGGTVTVIGNYIGTNATGTAALGNGRWGVHVGGGTGTRIGGAATGEGNVIAGQVATTTGGIYLYGTSFVVQGNTIGMNATGTAAIPNGDASTEYASGIDVRGGNGHQIGGTGAGEGNTIAGNQGHGVRVTAQTTRVLGNSIFNNLWLGIDLNADGVSANDGVLSGSQPNNGMDHPVFTGAGINTAGTSMQVYGFIGTGGGQPAFAGSRVEVFKAEPDANGYGEGRIYLGALTADASGRFSGALAFTAGTVLVGDVLTATATDSAGNTSEFGPNWTSTAATALAPAGFDAFETDTAAGALTGVIRSKTAGSAAALAVVALNTDGSALHAGFSGSVTLIWLDARDDSGAASGSCRASWVALGAAGTATFSSNNRVTVSLTPPASGTRQMRLQISHAGPTGTVTACSGDAFAALPATLTLAASDGDAATAGTTRALANTADSGGVVHRAGRPFTVSSRALDATGALMTGYDGTPTLAATGCLLPAGCTAGSLGGSTATAVAGLYANGTVTYAEAGAITLQLTDSSYAAVDSADTDVTARTFVSTATSVGRFVPDSLELALSASGTLATANSACMASGSGATFIGQGFGWATAPQLTVTARNAAGGTTTLWTGSLMKLSSSAAVPALTVSAAGTATLSSSFGSMAISDLGGGRAGITANTLDRFLLDLPAGTTQPSVTPGWAWSLTLSDASEAAVSGNPTLAATASQGNVPFNAGALFHSGRLSLAAAHGDARSGVRPLLQLQRLTTAGWVTLTEDRGCVTVQPQHLGVESPSGVFLVAGACAAPMPSAVSTAGGRAWLSLPATPGAAPGRLTLRIAGAATTGQSCTSSGAAAALVSLGLPWLTGGATGTGPAALATWGSPNRDLVWRRETW